MKAANSWSASVDPRYTALMKSTFTCFSIIALLSVVVSSADESEKKQHWALIEAIKDRDDDRAIALIEQGAPVNLGGFSPLHYAADYERPVVFAKLLAAGADIHAKDRWGATPLCSAAQRSDATLVAELIRCGAEVNVRISRDPHSALGCACRAGLLANARLLVEAGANINDDVTITPLGYAAQSGNAELVKFLLKKGADSAAGFFPALHRSAGGDVVRALVAAGADVEQRNEWGMTPLLSIAGNPNIRDSSSLAALVRAGARVDVRGKAFGRTETTPLHAAMRNRNVEKVKVLLKAGADPNAKDGWGNTAAGAAAKSSPEIAALFANIDGADDGKTPLQRAVVASDFAEVKRLLESGADVNATGPDKMTALHFAAEHGNVKIAKALITKGASLKALNARFGTPLGLSSNSEIAEFLIQAGSSLEAPTSSEVRWPLMPPICAAIGNKKPDVVRVMLKHESPIKFVAIFDALNMAALTGDPETLRVLLENQRVTTTLGVDAVQTALEIVCTGGFGEADAPMNREATIEERLACAKLLLQHGADVNNRITFMKQTTTILHGTVGASGALPIMKMLIEKGADINARVMGGYYAGATPLHFAVRSGSHDAIRLLLENGADVNALTEKNGMGDPMTPLDVAAFEEKRKILREYGGKTAAELKKSAD